MSKKNKFDLEMLIKAGLVKEGETLFFVSDQTKKCVIEKTAPHEYKVRSGKDVHTIHTISQTWLGQEPPGHASKWVKTTSGKTLYDLWQACVEGKTAA